ncbi:probable beta-hexosaminidase fdl isoform X2 [Leptopilina boulardi]|nr:probable beta-hexosaminidase fdl isoform X2 [Leptopilina boulardi]
MLEVPFEVTTFLKEMCNIFLQNMRSLCSNECKAIDDLNITIYFRIESKNLDLNWETNEKYSLNVPKGGKNNKKVSINASTVYGARHGLETLLQLIAPSLTNAGDSTLVIVDNAIIKDKPAYPHRGLLIDTARNFLPVKDILRTIDGLAASKLNILHWHATDSQSFPLEIKNLPLMTLYGAYSSEKVYSESDMKMVIKYAKARGVRVILEIDSPSHAGAGWEWGPDAGLGNLAVCINQQPWRDYCIQPPCGQLNPVNPYTLSTLRNLYSDILDIWDKDTILHLGGDELFINCWNSTSEITDEMKAKGMGLRDIDFFKLWSDFHKSQVNILKNITGNENTKAIVWSSHLTSANLIENYLDKSQFIIQTWVEAELDLNEELLNLGYNLIISTKNAWYLDHGFWGTTNYHTWRDVYNNRIPNSRGVLGGEACMWGEYVVSGSLDSRVWPRTAAIAERLWTNSPNLTTADVEPRLMAQRERLESRNIFPEAIAPEWCNQHETQCY